MILVIDVGNTRTKWALAADADTKPVTGSEIDLVAAAGNLSHFNACMNTELTLSTLKKTAESAKSGGCKCGG